MTSKNDLPIAVFVTREAGADWLDEHHASSPGVRLKIAKKDADEASVTQAEAVEVALCFGWIDSQRSSCDQSFSLLRFTPRKARSLWSRINRDKVGELIARGEMRPAGLREVERARADGRWEAAYEPQRTAIVPDYLLAALDRNEAARSFFATLRGANRYAILHRIQTARHPETRARRIAQFVAMLAEGRTPNR